MKIAQDLLDFYEVELGKKYKITKNKRNPDYYTGEIFVVKEPFGDGELWLEIGECDLLLSRLNELDYEEVKPEPLTDEEKDYLRAVIKPFRDSILTIEKLEFVGDKACIYIEYRRFDGEEDRTYLPIFNVNDLYLGMKSSKEYTLEELGL